MSKGTKQKKDPNDPKKNKEAVDNLMNYFQVVFVSIQDLYNLFKFSHIDFDS